MPDTPEVAHHGSGVKGFLTGTTAGLPNWAWILVVVAGVGGAILLPKLLGNKTGTTTSDTTGEGLGLALDPTTGLPYAVEGLVPSGAMPSGNNAPPSIPDTAATPVSTQEHNDSASKQQQKTPAPKKSSPTPSRQQPAPPPQAPAQYITVTPWPSQTSTLSGIAQKAGTSLARIEQLNPEFGPSHGRNWDLIYAGEKVRVA